jgi:phosphoribosyl 1,2-cyclic phosphate phosphodiesterase
MLIRYEDPSLRIGEFHETFNDEQVGVRQVLIDAGPELRQQALRLRLSRLDAVMLTHAHADHIFGLDDLRRFNAVMKAPIEVHAEPTVFEQLGRMFKYIFEPHTNVNQSFVAHLLPLPIQPDEPRELWGARWTPIRLMHGRLPILGYRIDFAGRSLAYCTDVSTIPPGSFDQLQDLDVLVIDGLRPRHHPTHFNIDQALEAIDRIAPGEAYLTHIAHDVSHEQLLEMLPTGVEPAYDGLRVVLDAKQTEARPVSGGVGG